MTKTVKKTTKKAKSTTAPESPAPAAAPEGAPAPAKTRKTAPRSKTGAPKSAEKKPKTERPPLMTAFGPIPINRAGKYDVSGHPCLCGCGGATVTPKARFISGHDSKMRKAIIDQMAEKMANTGKRLKAADLDLPGLTLAIMSLEPVAGLTMDDHGYMVDTKTQEDEEDEG